MGEKSLETVLCVSEGCARVNRARQRVSRTMGFAERNGVAYRRIESIDPPDSRDRIATGLNCIAIIANKNRRNR